MQINQDSIIKQFIQNEVGGIVLTDTKGNIIYADKNVPVCEQLKKQLERRGERALTTQKSCPWEFTDSKTKKFYRVQTSAQQQEDKTVYCHILVDVSDYANLYQDITNYSVKIADISDFQAKILSKISKSYEFCLPDLAEFCHSSTAILYIEAANGTKVTKIVFDGDFSKSQLQASVQTDSLLSEKRYSQRGKYHCLLCEQADSRRYAVYLKAGIYFNSEYFQDISLYNVIRLYIENAILKEKIIYENEHDHLTGLYNKGKYMALLKEKFGNPTSIAIFNFDVNDLKYMNDNFGHEAGDHLIRMAANSIHKVTAENIMGFRMGGDEFAMVALNLTQSAVEDLHKSWQNTLYELNKNDNRIKCVIACGIAYGEGDCNIEKLMEQADLQMYKDKKRLKEERIKCMKELM